MARIGVVIPARNEEKFLGKTLDFLLKQTRKPDIIVVVDDGSTDKTSEIARSFGVHVIRLADRGYYALGRSELAEVSNIGFRFLDEIDEVDYVMKLDAEQVLSRDYTEKLISRMERDDRIVIASGIVAGEFSRAPRASGRVYKFKFLRDVGFFPLNYSCESYPVAKALTMGYKVKVFMDLETFGQRPTKLSAQKLYFGGKGLKALGYDPIYVLWECLLKFFESPKGALDILRGYLSFGVKKYDINMGVWQRKHIIERISKKIKKVWHTFK